MASVPHLGLGKHGVTVKPHANMLVIQGISRLRRGLAHHGRVEDAAVEIDHEAVDAADLINRL